MAENIGTSNGVVLASGENFPDALSIASIAAAKQMPILLTQSKILPDSVKYYISNNSISKSYVVGGTDVINANVVKDLPNMKRLSGIDRYETNLNVINEFLEDFNFNNLYLAYGGDFPDALCASAAAAKDFAPIVLVSKSYTKAQSLIRSKIDSIASLKILGGTFAIPDTLVQSILYPNKTVLGYTTYYYVGDSSSYNSIINHSQAIDSIATDTYIMDSTGNIKGLVPYNQVNYANDNKIKTYAMVSNSFNADTAKGVLENSTNRQKLINNILQSLKANNYKGVNIDIENVYYYDRNYFTTFMTELYNTLNPQGFEVTIALPAKTSDSMWQSWIGAYDYAALAKVSDKIILMTYDEHWSGGAPGAIASIGWVQNVINYAITVIPRDKILLGLAAYAYDWPSNGAKAKSYGISQAYNIASQKGAQVKWDSAAKSPYFNYTDSLGVYHTVYFENSTSISYKLDIVNNYDLGGVSIWRLGLENSDYWETISNKFNRY
ncbi:glycosyl hydrolase family 18 protein [Clostridium ljungdahlii]|uniref:glycosyl hydrolase family 18 protein n=1 Tax=Clostridium ljungdahlii TaxID=1538 RepID=UPI0038630444